jgi:hypothetical protein
MEAAVTSKQTLAGWIILLRSNRERFSLPNPKVLHKQNHPLPELLECMQEEITHPWIGYCTENLANLTVDLARNKMNNRLIPSAVAASTSLLHASNTRTNKSSNKVQPTSNELIQLLEEHNRQTIDEQMENNRVQQNARGDYLLQSYFEHPISMTTTWRWLKQLGFSYSH